MKIIKLTEAIDNSENRVEAVADITPASSIVIKQDTTDMDYIELPWENDEDMFFQKYWVDDNGNRYECKVDALDQGLELFDENGTKYYIEDCDNDQHSMSIFAAEEASMHEAFDFADEKDKALLSGLIAEITQAVLAGALKDSKKNKTVDDAFGDAVNGKTGEVSEEAEEAAEEIAEATIDVSKILDIPDGDISVSLSEAEYNLESALQTALDERELGLDNDYPNVILCGLAGFGKTAIVKSFCKKHGLNFFSCDAKSLDIATVGGIPFPEKDKNGRLMQTPIASRYWDGLFKENTVLFLDEYNRAAPAIAGSLLSLINEHNLPITKKNKDGSYTNTHHFDNILFTVVAINPASGSFTDVQEMTPEKISRFMNIAEVEPHLPSYKKHVLSVLDKALSNPLLTDKLRFKLEGQRHLAETILNNPNFAFNTMEEVQHINEYNNSSGHTRQFLNYRTFFGAILGCSGTKADFKAKLTLSCKFWDSPDGKPKCRNIVKMFTICLADYKDNEAHKGNQLLNKIQQQVQANATAQQKAAASVSIMSALGDFENGLA